MPQWMEMQKDYSSIGAQFLNVFGLEFEDIEAYLDRQLNNQFIGTVNMGQIDILYKMNLGQTLTDQDTVTVSGDGTSLAITESLREFYETEDDSVVLLNRDRSTVYSKILYNSVSVAVNGTVMPTQQILHHVWNSFDEIGLLLDTPRLFGEGNYDYHLRILDVFKRPGSATTEGLQNYLGRQLGVAPTHIRTNTMDHAFVGTLLKPDGTASNRLRDIIFRIGEAAPVTWRHATWDQTYWQLASIDMLGIEYLPTVWDVSMDGWGDTDFKSGVGSSDDLKVSLPVQQNDEQFFDYFVGLRGTTTHHDKRYIPLSFMYDIYASGYIPEGVAPPEDYHIEIQAGEIVPLIFTVRAYREYVQSFEFNYETETYTISDDDIELVPGNQIMSDGSDEIQIRISMFTDNTEVTPEISNLKLYWYDDATTPVLHYEEFDAEAHWLENDSTSGVNITATGEVRLAHTEFDETIDTYAEWSSNHESSTNIEINQDGSISLKGVSS